MEHVKKQEAIKHTNSSNCVVYEYPIQSVEMNIGVAEITGRYPEQGWAINHQCTEMGYIVNGSGKLVTDAQETSLGTGDVVYIPRDERFYWEGTMTLVLPCSPAWWPEQHEIQGAEEVLQRNIKAVIFDCDGTLVDSEHAHFISWQYALQYHGGALSLEEYYGYIGKSASVIAEILAKKVGKDCAEEILSGKRSHYFALIKEGHLPIQHTMDFLHHLAREKDKLGLKLGLASAASRGEILLNLRHHGIEHLFDVILSGQDDLSDYTDAEGVNKPKPYIYLHAAKMLNLTPAECVVIEDSHSGVTAGKSAGCVTIAVPNSYTQYQDLSHAHLVIDSFYPMNVQEFLETVKRLKINTL